MMAETCEMEEEGANKKMKMEMEMDQEVNEMTEIYETEEDVDQEMVEKFFVPSSQPGSNNNEKEFSGRSNFSSIPEKIFESKKRNTIIMEELMDNETLIEIPSSQITNCELNDEPENNNIFSQFVTDNGKTSQEFIKIIDELSNSEKTIGRNTLPKHTRNALLVSRFICEDGAPGNIS